MKQEIEQGVAAIARGDTAEFPLSNGMKLVPVDSECFRGKLAKGTDLLGLHNTAHGEMALFVC